MNEKGTEITLKSLDSKIEYLDQKTDKRFDALEDRVDNLSRSVLEVKTMLKDFMNIMQAGFGRLAQQIAEFKDDHEVRIINLEGGG